MLKASYILNTKSIEIERCCSIVYNINFSSNKERCLSNGVCGMNKNAKKINMPTANMKNSIRVLNSALVIS